MTNKPTLLSAVVVGLSLATAAVAFGQASEADAVFQVRYASNLNIGDSVVNITNTGTLSGFEPAGNICANVYVFDPSEEMISCCSCRVTPNGLNSLSARSDLISNTLTPAVPTSIMIKLLSTSATGGCNASSPTAANLARGMRAWGTTVHALPLPQSNPPSRGSWSSVNLVPQTTFAVTETEFTPSDLSASELAKLTTDCAFIQTQGSGFGICKSCRSGGR